MNDEIIGNTTSIIKTITMIFAGYCLGYFISIGLNLPISQEQLSEILFTIICFIAAYFDMKYPNRFHWLKEEPAKKQEPIMEQILNDEYV